jgi:hypothetical protein
MARMGFSCFQCLAAYKGCGKLASAMVKIAVLTCHQVRSPELLAILDRGQ